MKKMIVYGFPRKLVFSVCFLVQLCLLPWPITARDPPSGNGGWNSSTNVNFDPKMSVIIVLIVSAFFFLGFFSTYIRLCLGPVNSTETGIAATGANCTPGLHGLEPSVIAKFPTVIYSDVIKLKGRKGSLECAVCLSEFDHGETLRLLPCEHAFHPECIDMWLSLHTTCPVCRSNLLPVPNATTKESSTENEENITVVIVSGDVEQQFGNEERHSNPNPNQNLLPPSQLTRCDSTGHRGLQVGENCDRFKLRLPEAVRDNLVKKKLRRAISCVTLAEDGESVSEGSVRRAWQNGNEGDDSSHGGGRYRRLEWTVKSDRWVVRKTPNYFSRGFSFESFPAKSPETETTTVMSTLS